MSKARANEWRKYHAKARARKRKALAVACLQWGALVIGFLVATPALFLLALGYEAGKSPENAAYVARLLNDIANLF